MAMDGSDSHGDGDRLAEYFGPVFKEYVLKEQLKWSLYKQNLGEFSRNFSRITLDQWVFWSEQDHEIEPSLSLDNCADFNLTVCAIPKVRDNIRHALQKLMQPRPWFYGSLVQFWAATKTLEGRTLLTTGYEPFALGGAFDPRDRVPLCNYRMGMCVWSITASTQMQRVEKNNLGFLAVCSFINSPNLFPKWSITLLKSIHNATLLYPTFLYMATYGDLGLCQCLNIPARSVLGYLRWCLCLTCLQFGIMNFSLRVYVMFFRSLVCNALMDIKSVKCSRGNVITNATTNNRRTCVFQELKTVMRLVREKHGLPLAMAWVPCSACNGLESVGVEYCASIGDNLDKFSSVSGCGHLRKGWVAEWALSLSSTDMLYFPSITKLSIDEYPLVPYARFCEFSGWFIIRLRSSNTGDDIYVLEFFWSTSSEDNENIQTRLNKLLGTMEDQLGNFRLASGPKFGYLSYVEVIDVQNNQKVHNVYEVQATRTFSSQDSDPSTEQSSTSVSNLRPW